MSCKCTFHDGGFPSCDCQKVQKQVPTKEPEFTLDWPHGHQTRNGIPVKVVGSYETGGLKRLAVCMHTGQLVVRQLDGKTLGRSSEYDIVNKPKPKEKREIYVYYAGSANGGHSVSDLNMERLNRWHKQDRGNGFKVSEIITVIVEV